MSESHSDMGMAFAFLAGALVGAGLALLLAPKPGEETRAQVADWMKQAQDKARKMTGRERKEPSETEAVSAGF